MTGFQNEVRQDLRTIEEIKEITPVNINVSMSPEVALQLAQFIKRSTLDTFAQFVEPHLTSEEHEERAYLMQAGILAVGAALADAGIAPR